ncbi:uncharacterized protein LOC111459571 isoform X2 [Cucurbita moschata]|nr:uncharacterized protein LOC111459571 isoform X2 [Cucurbita moschata]XP_022958323.1 uncharacterized protein LOC111459571 isoform X2 [Cucurbita moschata]
MEADELYLDLLALRQLYVFLLKCCLRDANSELVVGARAKILFKHLLDDATTGLLEFHSKTLPFYNFLRKDDKQTKPLDEKVAEWMEHNQTARTMANPEKIEHKPGRDRASASNVAANDLSSGISSALRRIELHILSLQRYTRSHISETKLAYYGQSVHQGNESLNHQKVKPMVANHCSKFVHGFRIPLTQDKNEAMKQHELALPPTLMDKSGCPEGSKATARRAMKLNRTWIQEKRSKNSRGRIVMRPTLWHNKTHLAAQQESEYTNSESESAPSSSPATRQTSESETTADSSSPGDQSSPPATGSEASSQCGNSSSNISREAFKFSHGKKESKKAVGRFKSLRNKLGLIFHHHHHHYHNGHNSMWKQVRRMFHRTGKKELTSKEEKNGMLRKTTIRSVSRNNQVGKFQALAEGLRSHVWKSKAMKKKEQRGLNCGKTNGGKKLHWWKMIRRRRGVKLPNKGRVKIGYVNKKPHVKII